MDHHDIDHNRLFFAPDIAIDLTPISLSPPILDIGGGGEGIIGQIAGPNVIAIDVSREELEEAPPGPVKAVIDARSTPFIAGSFATVTSFFTLFFIDPSEHHLIFTEVDRILRPGGEFIIWDTTLPERRTPKDIYVATLDITMSTGTVSTRYGTLWNRQLSIDDFLALASQTGFTTINRWERGNAFKLHLGK